MSTRQQESLPQLCSLHSSTQGATWTHTIQLVRHAQSPATPELLNRDLIFITPWKSQCLLQKEDFVGDFSNRVFTGGSDGKESVCNARDPCLIPRSRRSPGEGNGDPLQYFCLENSMDRGAWRATVHGVSESDTTE